MIGKLKGTVSEVEGNEALIETASGVYYKVFLTPDLLTTAAIDTTIELYTYLNVKEDSLTLFGFENKKKYALFQMLLGVDGVGPKLAFSIISFSVADEIVSAVTAQDHNYFSSIPGIGKKTAHKILLELSTKMNTEFQAPLTSLSKDEVTILDALNALGFDKRDAQKILTQVDKGNSIEEKIKQAIRLLTAK